MWTFEYTVVPTVGYPILPDTKGPQIGILWETRRFKLEICWLYTFETYVLVVLACVFFFLFESKRERPSHRNTLVKIKFNSSSNNTKLQPYGEKCPEWILIARGLAFTQNNPIIFRLYKTYPKWVCKEKRSVLRSSQLNEIRTDSQGPPGCPLVSALCHPRNTAVDNCLASLFLWLSHKYSRRDT